MPTIINLKSLAHEEYLDFKIASTKDSCATVCEALFSSNYSCLSLLTVFSSTFWQRYMHGHPSTHFEVLSSYRSIDIIRVANQTVILPQSNTGYEAKLRFADLVCFRKG